MRAGWLVAIAAGAAIGMAAPADLSAQGKSNRARQQQEMQRQRQQAREAARLEAERKQRASVQQRARREQANRSGLVLRRNDDYERARRERDRRDGRYNDPWDVLGRNDDRYDRRNDRYDRRGPAFCRSGEGHPVHGRQWCRDKGFSMGHDRSRDRWGDIIYRDRRYDNRTMGRSTLENILGSVVLGRFDSYGRSSVRDGSLNGRWLDTRATVLQLYMGSTPIARLIDTNRDGRVDNVSLLR